LTFALETFNGKFCSLKLKVTNNQVI